MPIINKGVLDTRDIFNRAVGNDWPTAQVTTTADVIEVSSNLYYTNARVQLYLDTVGFQTAANILANVIIGIDLSGNTTTDLVEGTNLYYTNARVESYVSQSLTTSNIAEGINLYYTNARARTAYTPGSGIAISANGVISTRGDDVGLGAFNSGINLAANLITRDTYQTVKTFSNVEGNSFIVFSFHITNISNDTAYLSGRYVIESNNVLFANILEIPTRTSIEVFTKPQIFKPGDSIQLISYNSNLVATNNLISSYVSYQASSNYTFQRAARTVNDNLSYTIIDATTGAQIIESLKLVNLESNSMPVTVTITDAADNIVAYLTSNIDIPPYTTIEICEYPKTIPDGYKIKVQKFDNPREMSILSSSKITSAYEIEPSSFVINEGDSVIFDIRTRNVVDGTVLYYEIQAV